MATRKYTHLELDKEVPAGISSFYTPLKESRLKYNNREVLYVTGEAIIELMKLMNEELGTTFIFSTHDPSIVSIADHIIKLLDGEIIENVRSGERQVVPEA